MPHIRVETDSFGRIRRKGTWQWPVDQNIVNALIIRLQGRFSWPSGQPSDQISSTWHVGWDGNHYLPSSADNHYPSLSTTCKWITMAKNRLQIPMSIHPKSTKLDDYSLSVFHVIGAQTTCNYGTIRNHRKYPCLFFMVTVHNTPAIT